MKYWLYNKITKTNNEKAIKKQINKIDKKIKKYEDKKTFRYFTLLDKSISHDKEAIKDISFYYKAKGFSFFIIDYEDYGYAIEIEKIDNRMIKVICIRNDNYSLLKTATIYYIDKHSLRGYSEEGWYGSIYTDENVFIGRFPINLFSTEV